tara:strand:+ start:367 stop:1062 length:696 start_codon:yes stop_codon:yes gene_type:complete
MTMFASQWFASVSFGGSNTANATSTSSVAAHNFEGQSLGDVDSTRVIAVAVGMGVNNSNRTIDSVTVGGADLTKRVGAVASNAGVENFRSEIWSAAIPTGATADIVVTMSGTIGSNRGVAISVHRLIGNVSAAPDATASDNDDDGTTDPLAVSVNTQINGYVVCCGVSFKTAPNTASWSGATELTDAMTGNIAQTAANYSATSSETPRTITVDFTTDGNCQAAASASWFPG